VWHASLAAGQVTMGVVVTHAPATQVLTPLHASASSLQSPPSLWFDHALALAAV
jgi:hypothetical protein